MRSTVKSTKRPEASTKLPPVVWAHQSEEKLCLKCGTTNLFSNVYNDLPLNLLNGEAQQPQSSTFLIGGQHLRSIVALSSPHAQKPLSLLKPATLGFFHNSSSRS
ncbi:hypothetical protein K1719_046112 [Acacia pycnantha]|nr:hypothetical protein K1719_046112 [Acacia pycnantha]